MPRKYVRVTNRPALSWSFRQLPFWDRVKAQTQEMPNGCHEFTGAKDNCGYGRINKDGRLVRLHRAVFEVQNGWIPKGAVVMHRCDNPACINPDHLSLGTQRMNIKDMDRKGRRVTIKGSQRATAKLHEFDIPKIKDRLMAGETCASIAQSYHVSEGLIRHVKKGRNWGHVS